MQNDEPDNVVAGLVPARKEENNARIHRLPGE